MANSINWGRWLERIGLKRADAPEFVQAVQPVAQVLDQRGLLPHDPGNLWSTGGEQFGFVGQIPWTYITAGNRDLWIKRIHTSVEKWNVSNWRYTWAGPHDGLTFNNARGPLPHVNLNPRQGPTDLTTCPSGVVANVGTVNSGSAIAAVHPTRLHGIAATGTLSDTFGGAELEMRDLYLPAGCTLEFSWALPDQIVGLECEFVELPPRAAF